MADEKRGKKSKSGVEDATDSIAVRKILEDFSDKLEHNMADLVTRGVTDHIKDRSLSHRALTWLQDFSSDIGDSALFTREVREVTRADGTSEKKTTTQFGAGKLIVIFVVVLLLIALAF